MSLSRSAERVFHCLTAVAILSAALAVCADAQDAMFRSNPAHTGIFNAPGVPEYHKVKWQFRTKGPVYSSP